MSKKNLSLTLLVFVALVLLSGCGVRERIAIDTYSDSYIWGGADVILYSDDHSTQKLKLFGDTGAINASGVITASGGIVQGSGTPGLAVLGNITMTTGGLINTNSSAAISVTDGLYVTSQIDGANGLAVTGNVTATGALTVTSWGRFYGLVLQPALAQVVTASYGITPGNYSLVFLADDGGKATGTIDLDGTVGIVNGTYQGQILVIVWTDADGASLKISDNSNVQFPANKYLTLAAFDAAQFLWHGTDWVYLGGGTLN